ncbi:cupin domain-containing protein [Sporolactobacillus inulinus]|uniref:Cupin domain-containing protein n=1 Tax=Sporolactobacillus inulinus TaxID=2078 RepID=A0A4Y1ZD20_9BACL|nr:cupin domain-containing protein [Sporolactobacillus inulinus]GAY76929.1 cupin domain-containing protein [Sporolactobacillus inulinus]
MQKIFHAASITPLLLLAACGGGQAASGSTGQAASKSQNTKVVQQDQSSESHTKGSQKFVKVQTFTFKDDGTIPNNPYFQVLIYPGAFKGRTDQIVSTFKKNNWGNNWVDGVFSYHHFHSTSHEVLGVISGKATLRLGGEQGKDFNVNVGDVVVLPAGTGHKRLSASNDFSIAGGYPDGRDYDLQTKESPQYKENISKVGKAKQDPVYGNQGPLLSIWKKR